MSRLLHIAALLFSCFALSTCYGQAYPHQYGPPAGQYGPPGGQYGPPAGQYGPPAGQYFDNGSQYGGQSDYGSAVAGGYGCDDCFSSDSLPRGRRGMRRTPIRNLVSASRSQPDCADCNLGPAYISLFGGVSFLDNFDSRFTFDNGIMGELGIRETGFSMEDGVASGASIGRYFYRQGRAEIEYTYRDNAVGTFDTFTYSDDLSTTRINDTLVDSTSIPAVGSMESSSVMVNFLMDLRPRTVGCMNGYLGGGLGALAVDGNAVAGNTTYNFDDAGLAFQGIAGINYPVLDRLDLFTEYRYLGSDNIRVEQTDMDGTVSLGAFRFDSHNVVFGIRILR